MRRYLDAAAVRKTQLKALANGARQRTFAKTHKGPGSLLSRTVEWDISGRCEAPVTVELHGRREMKTGRERFVCSPAEGPNFVQMEVRCRKCGQCLRYRAHKWRTRSIAECHTAVRTWFLTLTLHPDVHARALDLARLDMRKQGLDFDLLPEKDRFAQVDRIFFKEFQKRMKLLRKNSGAALRYLAVTETHKSGVPHWHLLVHENDVTKPLSYDRHWREFWLAGFWKAKLITDSDEMPAAKAAAYVCKYLTKSSEARVRASLRYGSFSAIQVPPEAEGRRERSERDREVPSSKQRTKGSMNGEVNECIGTELEPKVMRK